MHVISGISVAVIVVVTASMICIMSAFNGLEDLVKDLFGTLDADVALVPAKGAVVPQAWGESLNGIPESQAGRPFLKMRWSSAQVTMCESRPSWAWTTHIRRI